MSKKEFKLPPLSPLVGTDLANFFRVTSKGRVQSGFLFKYILTALIIGILSPFRWYERWHFRKIRKNQLCRPVFILGHWRSGTTFLHNLMCQPPNAGFISTYETVFTQYLATRKIIEPLLQWLMPPKRPADNVKLRAAYPQEEEFAMCNLTPFSYYHFFYFPELVERYFKETVRFSNGCEDEWHSAYELLLKKTLSGQPEADHLVIKNPVNTGRLAILRKYFPDAAFIHIYRNPYTVFLSTKKFFMELMPTLWFHEVDEEAIETLILNGYRNFLDAFYRDYAVTPAVFDIKFEDFEKDPLRTIEQIYKSFDLGDFSKIEHVLGDYIQSQHTYRKNTYSISSREVELVRKHWQVYLERWNYALPENMQIVDQSSVR